MNLPGIKEVIKQYDVTSDSSESHGVLCGMLCAMAQVEQDEWVAITKDIQSGHDASIDQALPQQRLAENSPTLSIASPDPHYLNSVHRETIRQLYEKDFGFCLVLPDDEQPLSSRIEALVSWCEGFLYGLCAGELKDLSGLPDQVMEFIRDMTEISRAYHDEDEEPEDNETDYTGLVEYIRVGVQLVFEELRPLREAFTDARVLH